MLNGARQHRLRVQPSSGLKRPFVASDGGEWWNAQRRDVAKPHRDGLRDTGLEIRLVAAGTNCVEGHDDDGVDRLASVPTQPGDAGADRQHERDAHANHSRIPARIGCGGCDRCDRCRCRHDGVRLQRRHKSIASPPDRFDAGRLTLGIEHFSQRGDVKRDVAFFDNRVGPDFSQDVGLGDHVRRARDE